MNKTATRSAPEILPSSTAIPIRQIRLDEKPGRKVRKLASKGRGIVAAGPTKAALADRGGPDGVFHNPGDAPSSTTVSNGGGPTIGNVRLRLIFWGSVWNNPATSPSAGQIVNAVSTMLASPYMGKMAQYGAGFGSIVSADVLYSPEPPNPFSTDDVGNKTWDLIDDGHYPEPDDDGGQDELFMFIMPQGVSPTGTSFIGDHSSAHDTDLFDGDDAYFAWISNNGSIDSITQIISHELVEACSDPMGDAWQVDPRNSSSWHEIGDVCASTATLDGVSVQSYWSNSDKACVIPGLEATTPERIYCAVFRSGTYGWDIVPNWDWKGVLSEVAKAHSVGMYPVSVDAFEVDGSLRFAVNCRPESAPTEIEPPTDWTSMRNIISQRLSSGWKMIAIDAFMFNGQRQFMGVFQQTPSWQVVVPDWDWNSMYSEIYALAAQGFLMEWISVFVEQGVARYAGIFTHGTGSSVVVPNWPWDMMYNAIFQNSNAGRVLRSLDAFTFNGNTRYAGAFREGSGAWEIVPNWNWTDLRNEISSAASRGVFVTDLRDCSTTS